MSKKGTQYSNRVTGPGIRAMNTASKLCAYCKKSLSPGNLSRHEKACKENPENHRLCPACNQKSKFSGVTCSYSCSNTYFRSGRDNPNSKPDEESSYRTIAFRYHENKCIICGEYKITSVHHYDHDHNNNSPENLVVLCPTHHQYVHSRYKDEVSTIIDEYVEKFKQCLVADR